MTPISNKPRMLPELLALALTFGAATPCLAWPGGNGGGVEEPVSYTLNGLVRDFLPAAEHPDFNVIPSNGYGHYCGNVALQLDDDKKPVFTGDGHRVTEEWRDLNDKIISWNCYNEDLGDHMGEFGAADPCAITSAATFAQWWRDVPEVNLSRIWPITLTMSQFGDYRFDANDFHPIDDELFGNGQDDHNYYFTYQIVVEFTYDASANQFFWFQGDDDCFVFVDENLVIDHGGIAGSRQMLAEFDRLGLEDGGVYRLHFFMAERHQPQSQFHIRTNVEFRDVLPPTVWAPFD